MSSQIKIDDIALKKGIYGLGFSLNDNLDYLNLVVLAISGIIIKLFFTENYSDDGSSGPASTTIWGYGLTALSLFFMIFMSIYLENKKLNIKKKKKIHILEEDNLYNNLSKSILSSSFPIFLVFAIIIYIIYLNFIYFTKINSNNASYIFSTYSFYSSLFLIVSIGIIIKYVFLLISISSRKTPVDYENNEYKNINFKIEIAKMATFILSTINFIFVIIMHIILAFFSTDG